MISNPFAKAGMLVLVLLVTFLVVWEINWRSKGYHSFYDDNASLWADKRARVYAPQDKATVIIGSSRIKFDLDIATWKELTGEEAIQLSIVGSSPLKLLEDLAADEKFKGKLLIDVTEPLYFSNAPPYAAKPTEFVEYARKETPTQRFGFKVSRWLESKLTFLNKEYLSFNGLLNQIEMPARENVFVFPYFPPEFEVTHFSRQSSMLPRFVEDTTLQHKMQQNWTTLFQVARKFPPATQEDFDRIFESTKVAVNKIKERGGKVLFVRTPASNPMLEGEYKGFPRDQFWNKLLTIADAEGIHFQDSPETAGFVCPEWSHLTPSDAVVYTRNLVVKIDEKGWNLIKK